MVLPSGITRMRTKIGLVAHFQESESVQNVKICMIFDRGACEPKGGEIVNKNIKTVFNMHNIYMIHQGCICRNVLSTFNSVPKIELTWMCTFFTWFPKASLARKLFSILVALASTYQNSVPPIYTVRGGLGQGWITNFSSGSRKPVSILNMFFMCVLRRSGR